MEIETVPLAAYESLATRLCRIIKYLIIGWACSVFALGLVLVISLSYSEDISSETVAQEAENYGSNVYSGGNYYGYETDDYEDEGYEEAWSYGVDGQEA